MSIAEKTITISANNETIAENEQKVYNAGYKKGKAEGGDSHYDAFWDIYQGNGNRIKYLCAFAGGGWTPEIFKPKYPMYPQDTTEMFFHSFEHGTNPIDLVKHCEDNNIIIDFSRAIGFVNTFAYAMVSHLGVIDMSGVNTTSNYFTSGMFVGCGHLKTIDKIISKGTISWNSNAFQNTSALENITFEGEIGTSLSFAQSSKLTKQSVLSIANALKDFSGTTKTATLTLHANSKALLTNEEKAIITQKGWTLA